MGARLLKLFWSAYMGNNMSCLQTGWNLDSFTFMPMIIHDYLLLVLCCPPLILRPAVIMPHGKEHKDDHHDDHHDDHAKGHKDDHHDTHAKGHKDDHHDDHAKPHKGHAAADHHDDHHDDHSKKGEHH
uniref:Uncharacterized protein n=1 Tax=Plectus sambesii TaxID=2011161 RepID=A0A914WDJ3_9BILA